MAHQLLVMLINCSNLALANRVSSGQASSRITDYPNCAKPGTLCVILQNTSNTMKLHLFILFTGLSTLSFGQSKQDKELVKQIDKSISDNYKNYALGCAVLIAKKSEVLLEKGYGTANIELNVPMKSEMVFRIGSITKQFKIPLIGVT